MADFMNNLKGASDYINSTQLNVPTGANVDLTSGTVTPTMTGISLKELICSLLAGNGIKLPNLQICLKVNIGRLLNQSGIDWQGPLAGLQGALNDIDAALDDFIAHTNIDNVLGRLNSAMAEIAAIANMINFCGTPIQPRPIPNMLGDLMGSFTGPGKDMLDNIGTMLDSDVGGCLGAGGAGGANGIGFSLDSFTGGILGEIAANWDDFSNGRLAQGVIDQWASSLRATARDLQELVEFENNFGSGAVAPNGGAGGSTFAPVGSAQRINTQVGMSLGDLDAQTIQQATKRSGELKALYDQTKAYEIDEQGNNLWHYLLEPELLARLEAEDESIVPITERQPVYDYCGKLIGYTDTVVNPTTQTSSVGGERIVSADPGNAGVQEARVVVSTPPASTTNLASPAPSVASSVPTDNVGREGDRRGAIAADDNYIYYCTADYDGESVIWIRSAIDTSW